MFKLAACADLRAGTAIVGVLLSFVPDMVLAQSVTYEDEPVYLGEVTIGARRREEEMVDVPVSVVVTDRQMLEVDRIDDTEDLSRAIAGYEQPNFGDDPRTSQPIIRGVGTLSTLLSPDNSTTTTIVDGVPFPVFGVSGQLLDVDQVEVLRGPQGTLFGRNSTAGAIVVRSRQPDGINEGSVNLELGTDGYARAQFEGGAQLSEDVAGRVALRFVRQDGYLQNDEPGQDDIGGYEVGAFRGALSWSPSIDTEATLSLGYENDNRDSGYPFLLRDSNAWQETPSFERKMGYATLNFRHDFGAVELYSVSSYLKYDIHNFTDNSDGYLFGALLGGLPPDMFTDDGQSNISDQVETQLYQEFRLQSSEGAPVPWVVGVAFSKNDYTEDAVGVADFFPTNNGTRHVELGTRSQAIFGDIIVPFAGAFEAGAGLRYTHEEKTIDHTFVGNGTPGTVDSFAQSDSRSFDMLTGRASLSYRLAPGKLLYASVAKGAKAGGYPRFTNNASYGVPETGYDETGIWSYELGTKMAFAENRGFLSAVAFYNDVTDEAVFTYDAVSNTFPIENMDVENYGLELEGSYQFDSGFALRAGLVWTHSTITGVESGSSFAGTVGNDTPNVPRLSTVLSASYTRPADFLNLPQATVSGTVLWRYVSERAVDPANSFDLEAANIINARLSLTNGNTEYYVFGENLLDEPLEQQGSLLAPGVASVVVGRGRTLGVGVTMRF